MSDREDQKFVDGLAAQQAANSIVVDRLREQLSELRPFSGENTRAALRAREEKGARLARLLEIAKAQGFSPRSVLRRSLAPASTSAAGEDPVRQLLAAHQKAQRALLERVFKSRETGRTE